MEIRKEKFGEYSAHHEKKQVNLYHLERAKLSLSISDYGLYIQSLTWDCGGEKPTDVVLGYDSFRDYCEDEVYMGCILGRYANRIAHGRFHLDGQAFQLSCNEVELGNHLHGGFEGFNRKLWSCEEAEFEGYPSLRFRRTSLHGEEGFPASLELECRVWLSDDMRLVLEYEASSDQPCPVNLSNHSYFNLSGCQPIEGGVSKNERSPSILDHELCINARNYTPTDENKIPTGSYESLGNLFPQAMGAANAGEFQSIAKLMKELSEQVLDHNFVIAEGRSEAGLRFAAALRHPSGRKMEVWTSMPGVQIYNAAYLDDVLGKQQVEYAPFAGICLETQFFPDSPNKEAFPSSVLQPGQRYLHRTEYRFFEE